MGFFDVCGWQWQICTREAPSVVNHLLRLFEMLLLNPYPQSQSDSSMSSIPKTTVKLSVAITPQFDVFPQIKLILASNALSDLLKPFSKVSFLFPISFSSRLHRERPPSFAQSQGRSHSDFGVQTPSLSHGQHLVEERQPAHSHQRQVLTYLKCSLTFQWNFNMTF